MSCYEWSYGKIKLPSAEYAKVRQGIAAAVTRRYEKQFNDSQAFWKSLSRKQQTDPEAYLEAVNALRVDDYEFIWKLQGVVSGYRNDNTAKPRRLLKKDWDWPTNRTLAFHESDLSLYFDPKERTITFDVGENNHAREHADNTTLARAFYTQMGVVKWTHGTGGVVLGNDEYNREAGHEHEGGGGSYVVSAWGYIGAKEAPEHMGEFFTTKGVKHVQTEWNTRTGKTVGKIVDGYKPRTTSYGYGGSRW